jgi:hypothetical protein
MLLMIRENHTRSAAYIYGIPLLLLVRKGEKEKTPKKFFGGSQKETSIAD